VHDAKASPPRGGLAVSSILWFWLPLAATWLMMSAEGPYVAAIIARMPEAAFNLAAYGVAFSLAWLVESPIMMLLTASNSLVRDRPSFLALRRFAFRLNALLTVVMVVGVLPPVFRFATGTLMGLPDGIVHLAHIATAILVPWPAAIGYRRFYQGILVRHGLTRRVAYGTVVRLATMSATAAALALGTAMHGASIGATALVTGVLVEAVASRVMARHLVASLLAGHAEGIPGAAPLTQRGILRFYYPLGLTSVISLVTGPLLTFFMGRSRAPIESLAVLPVVQSLVFLFRSGGVAFQEVGVALLGRSLEHRREVGRAMRILASGATIALAVMLFTPLADAWFNGLSGLPPDLSRFALVPARLLVLLPAMEYWLSYQRSGFILSGHTRVITLATAIEVAVIAMLLFMAIGWIGMVGAVAGSVAQISGRLASSVFLLAVSRAPGSRGQPAARQGP
jgi:progressive ankylosis protein